MTRDEERTVEVRNARTEYRSQIVAQEIERNWLRLSRSVEDGRPFVASVENVARQISKRLDQEAP